MVLRALSRPRWKDVPAELGPVFARYPRAVELPDGTGITLRPLVPRDEGKLVRLFADIPYEDLRNLHDNVSDPVIVRRWCRQINYHRVLPIVAELDGKIVSDATLHRRAVQPMRGVGRFRAYVRPEYRRRGIGAVLLKEILDLARALGLKQLAVELYQDQRELRKMLLRYGFRDKGLLPVYQRVILMREIASEEAEGDELAGTDSVLPL
jgi:GNAT superfamily N-acetyltransferase